MLRRRLQQCHPSSAGLSPSMMFSGFCSRAAESRPKKVEKSPDKGAETAEQSDKTNQAWQHRDNRTRAERCGKIVQEGQSRQGQGISLADTATIEPRR